MRTRLVWVTVGVIVVGACWDARVGWAADSEMLITLEPMRQPIVNGDRGKFRAHHWMSDTYVGGIKEASGHIDFGNGTLFTADGHALIDQNDLGAELSLKNEKIGFVNFDYSEFRKYYDGTGGVYYRFPTLSGSETDRELALNIGKFGLETGLTLEGLPELTFLYEREFKDGVKSRLSWTSVTETIAGSDVTRKIGPSWQDMDEAVDTFALGTAHEVAGFALKGEQRWEFVRAESLREEKNLCSTASCASTLSSNEMIRRQDVAPESTLMTTTLGAERSFLNDKVFFSSGYHFAHMNNREFETIVEADENGTATNFSSNAEQVRDARGDNDYDTHTWVGSVMTSPWSWLTLGTKLKAETVHREGNSSYPKDNAGGAPNGTIDTLVVSLNKNRAVRWGEGLSLRFRAIPRTALYTEVEFEQARVILAEDRKDIVNLSNTSDTFNRYTVGNVRRGTWTLGGRFDPSPWFDLTTQARRRVNNNDYDDQRESVASGTALSAFIDVQNIHTNEVTTRATFKPCRWFRPSFRYQFRDDNYSTGFEAQQRVKTGTTSHIYTYDVMLQPVQQLVTTVSFSRQTAVTTTPAGLSGTTSNVPDFHADVNSWLFSADYTPKANVSLYGNLLVSSAENFNDYTATGMPFGADFDRADLTTGMKWSLSEDTSFGTQYAYYTYLPNSLSEVGNYHAHVIWLDVSKKF